MANPYDVPPEMRDFAERSVAQARKAFETFMGAVQKTTGALDAAPSIPGAKDMSAKAVAFAESNVNSAFDLADKLVHAKDMQDVMAIQAEYLKSQLAAIETQMKELGDAVQKAAVFKK
ncbi:MAG: phasin [Hyphomicrobiales bacterium]|nr:phasin [Hyphomicrobiales bacterium]